MKEHPSNGTNKIKIIHILDKVQGEKPGKGHKMASVLFNSYEKTHNEIRITWNHDVTGKSTATIKSEWINEAGRWRQH